MIFEKNGRVRLTPHELNLLRSNAGLEGKTIQKISTIDELLAAVLAGLPAVIAADLLQFLERTAIQTADSPGECHVAPDDRTPPR